MLVALETKTRSRTLLLPQQLTDRNIGVGDRFFMRIIQKGKNVKTQIRLLKKKGTPNGRR